MVSMRALFLTLPLLFTAPVYASPGARYVLHEKRHPPAEWTKVKRLEPHTVLPLRIGLSHSNTDSLEDLLLSVSHPDSPEYGKHWTPEAIAQHFAPSEQRVNAVVEWLMQEGGIGAHRLKLSKSKGWLEVAEGATTAEVESLLKTEYHVWEHASGGQTIGCTEYSIPHHMTEHVDVVTPTISLHLPKDSDSKKRGLLPIFNPKPRPPMIPFPSHIYKQPPDLSNCSNAITPICLQTLYNFAGVTPVETKKNSFAVLEFTPNAYRQSDLDMFFKNFTPSLVGVQPQFQSIDGGVLQTVNVSLDDNGESDVDVEYAMALTAPQPVQVHQVGDIVVGGGFDNWLDALDASYCGGDDPDQDGIYPDTKPGGFNHPPQCGTIKPPNVISSSWGQDEFTATSKYATRLCNEFGKLGLAGTTFIFSSADNGVAGGSPTMPLCGLPNGTVDTTGKDPAAIRFNPSFPGTCPYVTTVGATQIHENSTVFDPETACYTKIFSGGGFSNIFRMPSYQASAVNGYLSKHRPSYSAEQYNQTGSRAFPDVSANGAFFTAAVDDGFHLGFGTSEAAPTFASVITLINDARIHAGKSPVGFINPAIYTAAFRTGFHDIKNGTNPGCGTQGFQATEGWDPVTGLGTPNYPGLKELFLALP